MTENIASVYNFSDFTTSHYRALLETAKSRYEFIFYDQVANRQSYILWRHDVDFSIHRAYKLALIEHELGVKSTYFVHLHNEYYNLLEKEIAELVYKIKGLGHQIGLHFDTHFYAIQNEQALAQKIDTEKKVLKFFFDIDVKVFSFHNTTPFTMNCQNWEYAGLINTYAKFFQQNVEYCSDSNGYWRFKRLMSVLETSHSKRLQVLTHPEWWQDKVMSPWQRIQTCIDGRSARNKGSYMSHLKKFGMKTSIGMEKLNKNSKLKIVMCGCLEMGVDVVRHLMDNGIEIDYFVTISPTQAAKYKVSGYEDYKVLADEYNIPIYYADTYSLTSAKDVLFFKDGKFDILIQGGWQRLFPQSILESLRIGAIGIHGSCDILPKGRGRSPINWSLIEGQTRFIFHYFLIKPGIDDGDIFYYESVDINEWDTCRTLYYKNSIVTKRVMLEWIPKLATGSYELRKQKGEPTYYPKRSADDGLIDWNKNVFDIYNFVRALTRPYPGAFTFLDGIRINLWSVQPFDTRLTYYGQDVGEIIEVFKTGDFVVNCNGGLLLVTDFETKGKIEKGFKLTSI